MAFAVWFIVRSTVFVDQTPFIQARQTLAFPIGILLSLYIDKIRVLLSSRRLVAILSVAFLAFGVGIYAFLHFSGYGLGTLPLLVYNFISLFTCVFCALGIIGLTHLIKPLQNAFMQKVSIFTLEIYLLHGYLISYNSLTGNYPGILLLDVLLCITSVIMHYICAYALNLIKHVIERKDNA